MGDEQRPSAETTDIVEPEPAPGAGSGSTQPAQTPGSDEITAGGSGARARPGSGSPRSVKLDRGDEVGRYVILERVGAGGMGVVYAAWDPALDRKIALKLLLPDRSGHDLRLEREAQAMARVTHPNVLAVHDVGEVDGRVFMAMEFVEGQTLGAWIKAQQRDWAEVIEVMIAAGRGLAAAHDHGLIHRDFKPDNVMIGDDDRVRVMDFGLVRAASEASEGATRHAALEDLPHMHANLESSALESQLTQAGSLLGTPAYTAPEQLRGEDADARADQFSYCITSWQCLYGARPFAGDTPLAVLFAISHRVFSEPPPGRSVPPRIRRVLERGLAAAPADRWPDMAALLEALAADPNARRRPWLLGLTAAAVAAAAATAAIVHEPELEQAPEPCARAGEEISEDWSDARADQLIAAFSASELVYAGETWGRVHAQLDGWAGDWVKARRDSCAATQIRHEQSPELLDLRMACLDRRRQRFAALIDVLAEADDAVIEKAVEASEALPRIEVCADHDWLTSRSRPPEDPALASAVARIGEQLQVAEAMTDAGQASAAQPHAATLDAEATALGWQPLIADTAAALGRAELERGEFEAAAAALERAFFASRRSGEDEVSIITANRLVYSRAVGLGDLEGAERWAAHALAEAERVEQRPLLAEVYASRGILDYTRGDPQAALAAFRLALDLHSGPETSELGIAHINYGTVIVRVDPARMLDAFAELNLGLDILERRLGPHHPMIAGTLSNYATVHGGLGQWARAVELLERALEIHVAAAGDDHPITGLIHLNLASNLRELGEDNVTRALDHARASQRIHVAVYGETHAMVAESRRAIGKILLAQGQPRRAVVELEAARAIWGEQFGPDHIEIQATELVLSSCDLELGNPRAAIERLEWILQRELSEQRIQAAAQRSLAPLIAERDPDRAEVLEAVANDYFDALKP